MILKANNISFSYNKSELLKNFSLEVASKEKVGIMGKSGKGKTTLLKILAGYLKAKNGTVTIDGSNVYNIKGYSPVQMIWQHPEEVLNAKLKMKDILKDASIDQRIINSLGIKDEWLLRYPKELSGGELQRFSIARSLGEKTKFILADEITTMYDLINQKEIWNFIISEINKREIGLIAVSHNKDLLEQISHKIININEKNGKQISVF